jgi:transcriptional regulator with XRE-family HTH domain
MPHLFHTRFDRPAPATRVLDPEVQDLGPRLQALRARAGLSQRALAKRSCLGLVTIVKLEQDKRPAPRLTTFVRLARGLGLTLNALLNELFPPP